MSAPVELSPQMHLSSLARRPATSAAVFLILGVLAHAVLPDRPDAYLIVAATATLVALIASRFNILSTLSLALSIALLGLAAAQLEHFHFAADHLIAYTGDGPRLAELELIIDAPPRTLNANAPGGRPLPPRQVTQGIVTRVKTAAGWQPASGVISVAVSPPKDDLAFGQRVTVQGMLSRPEPAMNPGQFDWAVYYREQRILASIDAPHPLNIRILAPPSVAPINWLRQGARDALERGFSKAQSVDHALLRALLLGDTDPQLRDIQDDFTRTGTSHHLSISGMHVAVLGGVVFFICRMLRLSPRKSAIVMMAFVVLYGLVALPAPPVLRSIILCLVAGTGILLRRTTDGVQLLALTIFVMLLIAPLDLYNAGFQLSFLTVFGLLLYATRLARKFERHDEDERVLLSIGQAPTRMRSIRNYVRSHIITDLCTGAVAWAVSAPLILQHFDQINPWAILAGIALALPVFASMIGGLLKIVLTLVLPFGAPAWAWLAAQPVELMRWLVAVMAKIPGSDIVAPAIPVAFVLLYYALLAAPLIPTARRQLKWAFRGGAITACATALMLPLLIGFAPRGGQGELRLTLLYVGAGQCAVLELPSHKTILFDAGSSTMTELERHCIEPFLRHHGVSHVDAIYISHADFDHLSAVARAAEHYQAGEVVVTPYFRGHAAKSYPARMLLESLAQQKVPVNTIAAGRTVQLGDGCTLEVLWPPPDGTFDTNESCQVLRLCFAGRSILLPADIQTKAESALAADAAALQSDVLIAPHHGSAEETTARFLDAVNAPTILASDDRTPSGKQRAFDKLIGDRTLLRTHNCGAITVTISPDGKLSVSTFLKK